MVSGFLPSCLSLAPVVKGDNAMQLYSYTTYILLFLHTQSCIQDNSFNNPRQQRQQLCLSPTDPTERKDVFPNPHRLGARIMLSSCKNPWGYVLSLYKYTTHLQILWPETKCQLCRCASRFPALCYRDTMQKQQAACLLACLLICSLILKSVSDIELMIRPFTELYSNSDRSLGISPFRQIRSPNYLLQYRVEIYMYFHIQHELEKHNELYVLKAGFVWEAIPNFLCSNRVFLAELQTSCSTWSLRFESNDSRR